MSTSSEANPSTDLRHDTDGSAADVVDGVQPVESAAEASPPADEDQHSWPVSPRTDNQSNVRAIQAGPDLEIVPDEKQSSGQVDADPARSDQGQDGGRSTVAMVFAFLVGRIDQAEAARHVVEHRRPLLWIWRRVVGMSFAYILVSVTWFLIKLPSALVADATIPSQVQVAAAFHELRIDGIAGATLGAHAGSSLFRFAAGLGVGAACGITLGIITGSAPLVRTIVDPVTSFFRLVPGLAAGPLLLLWFGFGEAGLISVVAFSVMWATMASASDGRTAAVRRGSEAQTGSDASNVDAVFDAVRAAVLVAWTTMLAIETVAASTGLGAMVWFAQGRSDLVVAGILIIGLIGFTIDSALRLTQYVITYDAPGRDGQANQVGSEGVAATAGP